mmetsp:Transcript_17497/g.39505  ORF Transcript_17497/g.39505 Transcript_17497/m.39505 type:complete len:224 (-) Transcript_17497:119-790(-)
MTASTTNPPRTQFSASTRQSSRASSSPLTATQRQGPSSVPCCASRCHSRSKIATDPYSTAAAASERTETSTAPLGVRPRRERRRHRSERRRWRRIGRRGCLCPRSRRCGGRSRRVFRKRRRWVGGSPQEWRRACVPLRFLGRRRPRRWRRRGPSLSPKWSKLRRRIPAGNRRNFQLRAPRSSQDRSPWAARVDIETSVRADLSAPAARTPPRTPPCVRYFYTY